MLYFYQEFLDKLNEYRNGLGSRLGSINERSESRVRNQVTRLSEEYRELLARANRLSDKLTGVGGRQREYSQALERLRSWLNQAEPQAIKVSFISFFYIIHKSLFFKLVL